MINNHKQTNHFSSFPPSFLCPTWTASSPSFRCHCSHTSRRSHLCHNLIIGYIGKIIHQTIDSVFHQVILLRLMYRCAHSSRNCWCTSSRPCWCHCSRKCCRNCSRHGWLCHHWCFLVIFFLFYFYTDITDRETQLPEQRHKCEQAPLQ
jgi:hypothetical protein